MKTQVASLPPEPTDVATETCTVQALQKPPPVTPHWTNPTVVDWPAPIVCGTLGLPGADGQLGQDTWKSVTCTAWETVTVSEDAPPPTVAVMTFVTSAGVF